MLWRGKNKGITRTVTANVLIVTLVLWAYCLFTMTIAVSQALLNNAADDVDDYIDRQGSQAEYLFPRLDADSYKNGGLEAAMQQLASNPAAISSSWYGSFWLMGDIDFDTKCFSAICNEKGEIAAVSQKALIFSYYDDEGTYLGEAVILTDKQAPNAVPQQKSRWRPIYGYVGINSYNDYRVTGIMDGACMTLQKIEGRRVYDDTEETKENMQRIFEASGDLVSSSNIEVWDSKQAWVPIYVSDEAPPEGGETVTLRTISFNYYATDYDDNCESLVYEYIERNIIGGESYVYNRSDELEYRRLTSLQIPNPSTGEYDGEQWFLVNCVICSPLKAAMGALIGVYIISFAMALLWPLAVGLAIRRYVEKPLRMVNDDWESGYKRTRLWAGERRMKEIDRLAGNYDTVTERLAEADAEVTRMEKALKFAEDAEQNRRRMSSQMAHELKTPLAVIHSYTEGLREHIADDKREHYLDVITDETERMDSLVMDMLDLSRMEAGRTKLYKEDFSLTELAQSVISRLEKAAEAKSLRLKLTAGESCPVYADKGRIDQVITNFLVNAIKHTPTGGAIDVRVSAIFSGSRFELENDGEPISEEALPRLWESFYTSDESGNGTGLGLAISKSILELHGGKCGAGNSQRGVIFWFTI